VKDSIDGCVTDLAGWFALERVWKAVAVRFNVEPPIFYFIFGIFPSFAVEAALFFGGG